MKLLAKQLYLSTSIICLLSCSPMVYSMEEDYQPKTLEQILDLKPVPTLIYWSSLGRVSQVKAILDSGEDSNILDSDGYSALHAAAENGHLDVVKLLIEHGADIHYKSEYTALELAKMADHNEIVKYLLTKGAQ